MLTSIPPAAGSGLLALFQADQNLALSRGYLHNFPDDAIEKSHQLAGGQLNLLLQLVHRLMLQANPQEKSLEDGRPVGVTAGTILDPLKWHWEPELLF